MQFSRRRFLAKWVVRVRRVVVLRAALLSAFLGGFAQLAISPLDIFDFLFRKLGFVHTVLAVQQGVFPIKTVCIDTLWHLDVLHFVINLLSNVPVSDTIKVNITHLVAIESGDNNSFVQNLAWEVISRHILDIADLVPASNLILLVFEGALAAD